MRPGCDRSADRCSQLGCASPPEHAPPDFGSARGRSTTGGAGKRLVIGCGTAEQQRRISVVSRRAGLLTSGQLESLERHGYVLVRGVVNVTLALADPDFERLAAVTNVCIPITSQAIGRKGRGGACRPCGASAHSPPRTARCGSSPVRTGWPAPRWRPGVRLRDGSASGQSEASATRPRSLPPHLTYSALPAAQVTWWSGRRTPKPLTASLSRTCPGARSSVTLAALSSSSSASRAA
jgi:hypothetical protein